MTESELRSTLSLLSYKPGTRFRLGNLIEGKYYLKIIQHVQDAKPPHQFINVGYTVEIDADDLPFITQATLIKRMTKWLLEMETHELEEWFKINNRLIYVPHQKESKA